jgi:secreted trypsin-like serine protease
MKFEKFFSFLICSNLTIFVRSDQLPLECGKQNFGSSFIVGGSDSEPGQWPWHATLFKGQNEFFCGSSIISNSFLLTGTN